MTSNCEEIDIAIGQRVRLARRDAGLSQEALADKLGLTFQQVQKYEKGANRIACSRMVQIAQALGRPVAYFFQDAIAEAELRRDGHDAIYLAGHNKDGHRLVNAAARLAQACRYDQLGALANIAEQLSPPPAREPAPALEAAE